MYNWPINAHGTHILPQMIHIRDVTFNPHTWWRHQMETFSALLAICAGNSPVPGEFSAQRPVTQRFDVFFDLRLNKRLSKHSWGWWFETLSCPLWCHCNDLFSDISSLSTIIWVKLCMTFIIRFCINSLTSGKFEWNFRYVIFKRT